MRGNGRRSVSRRWLAGVLAAVAAVALPAPAALAAGDPGRWRETGRSILPLYYYQGITSDPQRNFYFDGIYFGLYRTDSQLSETARNDDVIPPAVTATEGYNHIGDISWDGAEGGRILLPLECYYPPAGNTCKTGSIGVADPATLRWRYYVKLDPAQIQKVMWNEVSPDGQLVWTSSGKDLLAYRTADINAANAAPAGAKIRAVKRLTGAVPDSGITGAAFYRGRLFVAGQGTGPFQIWSIDLSNGSKRLEIEREIVGESEGLDVVEAVGGVLHWLIQPYNNEGPPTYGPANGTLLHFVPVNKAPAAWLSAAPNPVLSGETVSFDGSASSDSDGTIVNYSWDLDGNGTFETDTGSTATTSRSYPTPGVYTVRLRVTDDGGATGEAAVILTVENRPPTASFTYSPSSPRMRETVTFTSTSTDPDGHIASHAWDLDNDGEFDDGSGSTASRSFQKKGTHTVHLRVVDDNGAEATATETVKVTNPAGR
jgi:PKD repeat protein